MALADLVLQLSSKPESFGRTVIEALSLGRPVLGWAHGGVGELLAELYPDGAVDLGNVDALVTRARALLAAAPVVSTSLDRYRLDRMQAQTLALYAELCNEVTA